MRPPKKASAILLMVSVVLLCSQFILVFSTSFFSTNYSVPMFLIHLVPYLWLLFSIYSLFGKSDFLSRRGILGRYVVVIVASYGVAGGVFLLLVTGLLIGSGPDAVETLFHNLPVLIAVTTFIAAPLVNRFLR
jgi:hypothetical protein